MHDIWIIFDPDIIKNIKSTKKNMFEKNEVPKEYFDHFNWIYKQQTLIEWLRRHFLKCCVYGG